MRLLILAAVFLGVAASTIAEDLPSALAVSTDGPGIYAWALYIRNTNSGAIGVITFASEAACTKVEVMLQEKGDSVLCINRDTGNISNMDKRLGK